MSYWDTSALVKLYLVEPDSSQYESLALASPVATGAIAKYELHTVFRRREAEAAIPPGEAKILYERVIADIAGGMLSLQPIPVMWSGSLVKCWKSACLKHRQYSSGQTMRCIWLRRE